MFSHSPIRRNLAAMVVGFCALASSQAATIEDLNSAMGAVVWNDENLWDDAPAEVAARLQWPKESETPRESSFRLYPGTGSLMLGARPYSLALYGEDGKVVGLSMVFANKGDVEGLSDLPSGPLDANAAREIRKATKNFKQLIDADEKTIVERLTTYLGPPATTSFGQGRQTREQVKRWDWNGHSILLAAPRGEYVAVRIVPQEVADGVRAARMPEAQLREDLVGRVERRPNGDVIVTQIPMVDQGPKGFCVPATWERALRYMGIPADMYILAMAGNTEIGGGTSISAIIAGAKELVTRAGRRLDEEKGAISVRSVAKYIDKGLPIMWAMFVDKATNHSVTERFRQRANADMKTWNDSLADIRKAARKIKIDSENAHVCMIIGYNADTNEIAISDSWGPAFTERWITIEEANAISQGAFMIVNF